MSRSRVTSWPTYLLTGVPENTRLRLTEDALALNESTSEVIRQILCRHYRLRCQPVKYMMSVDVTFRVEDRILRLQPKLMRALRNDSRETGLPVRTLILDALDKHYAAVA